ncbi:hypothetical protein DFH94DRAFT_172047 [Russula ochroleuca]|uniref:Uncharacterized protein n=1 Tax=Russula ochroleuca TaxID=152965 RepID=A0A9P5N4B0_9AGAM|nr:hypothetical protein DFH94DRAFT_172047 [Russula ochroleuca]
MMYVSCLSSNSPFGCSFPKFSKTAPGIGKIPPNFLNKKPEKSEETTGLLSKGCQIVSDKLLKLILPGLPLCFSILRRFIPSFILTFLIFFIPPILAFYELALRVYFPRLPSVFAIAFKLYQRGNLTVDTIIWLASSLPASFLSGFGALGGVAVQTTAVVAGGAASAGTALVGTTTGIVGNASEVAAQGINHLKPSVVVTDVTHVLSGGARIATDQATSITAAGVHGVAVLADGTTQAVVGGLSLVNSPTAVKENISYLVTGEHTITPPHLVPDIAKDAIHTVVDNTSTITGSAVGATKVAVTENVTKLANVLDNVNPLHVNIMSKGSQDSQVRVVL